MIQARPTAQPSYLRLRLPPSVQMTDDQFYDFCRVNRDLQIEKTVKGDLIVMPPTGGEIGARNSALNADLKVWARVEGNGVTFDSSTGFRLPNGANRSPDASWVKRSRLATLTREEKQKFIPLCPDFVVELRSPSAGLTDLQDKMQEYIDNSTQLGWLIDPQEKRVYLYRPDSGVVCLEDPSSVSGEDVLPGFVLNLGEIWEPDL